MARKVRQNFAIFGLSDIHAQVDGDECYVTFMSGRTKALVLSCLRYTEFLDSRWYVDDEKELGVFTDIERDQIEDLVGAAQKEIIMSCTSQEIVDALLAIAASGGSTGGCGCGSGGAGNVAEAPSSVAPGPPGEQQGNPPEGFSTWQQYEDYKCDVIEYYIDLVYSDLSWWEDVNFVNLTATTVAGALFTPVPFDDVIAFVALMTALVVEGVFAAAMVDAKLAIVNGREDIKCAWYDAGTATQAISSVHSAIDIAIDNETTALYGAVLKNALHSFFNQNVINEAFEKNDALANADVMSPGDCSGCSGCGDSYLYGSVDVGDPDIHHSEPHGGLHKMYLWLNSSTAAPNQGCGPDQDITLVQTTGFNCAGVDCYEFREENDNPLYVDQTPWVGALCGKFIKLKSNTAFTVEITRSDC